MKGSSHLRSVRGSEENAVQVKKESTPETRGSWLESTNIPGMINDMERMMTEAFRRPFAGVGWTPWKDLLQEVGRFGGASPAVDVYEDDGHIVVKADIPGLSRDEISVKLIENTLEISGEKTTEEKVDRRDYLRVERTYGRFNRVLRLPEGLDADNVAASFTDGVLEVRIPKVEDKRTVHNIPIG